MELTKPTYCEVCGISSEIKRVMYSRKFGQVLCDKHRAQMQTKGRIIDPTQFSCFDRNEYTEDDKYVYMVLRNRKYDVVGTAIFDKRFKDKVVGRKWRPVWKSPSFYPATIGTKEEGKTHVYLHRKIMEWAGFDLTGVEVDHINGDTMDNRLENLRIATRQDQMFNVSTRSDGKIPVRGVSFSVRDQDYRVDFAVKKRRYYVKHFMSVEEAVYVRYVLERELIGDIALNRHYPIMLPFIEKLSVEKRQELEEYTLSIIEHYEDAA